MNYEARSKACLGPAPSSVTVERRLIESGRRYGVPYEREVGRSTTTVVFKPDLGPLAEAVKLRDPSVTAPMLGLFSQPTGDAMEQVLRGTVALMSEFDCASPVVRTFEDRLLEYLRASPRR